jgi:uracil-DNA glycosylase
VPHHPHAPGKPLSNRRPTVAEVAAGAMFAERALELLRPRTVVAVGRIAESVLGPRAAYVRHPANGGGAAFAAGMREILSL